MVTLSTKIILFHTLFIIEAKPNKRDLLRMLSACQHQWREIGEGLQVDYGVITSIQHDNTYTNVGRLSEILQVWFDKMPTKVTWRVIIEVVEEPPVSNVAVVGKMCEFLSQQ